MTKRKLILLLLLVVGLGLLFFTVKKEPSVLVEHQFNNTTIKIAYHKNQAASLHQSTKEGTYPLPKIDFEINKQVLIDGSTLKLGTYHLTLVPKTQSFKVLFNAKLPWWKKIFNTAKDSTEDQSVLTLEVPKIPLLKEVDQFAIYFENANGFTLLIISYHKTSLAIPITTKEMI
ncbi:DUF2911 domain-containing protein [Aquimarina brevivitae]|uniref:DUF2911 family protein n=1 Tax=Aquimarina brevivitae TaxID=323412 RepID=A0A4Q7PI68_9FLAO|nr:DUF2911 domain-containing protein [Aquimarina brevivitae]RZT00267.1 DUF2911 family protein [Aquimarina brevivitae]